MMVALCFTEASQFQEDPFIQCCLNCVCYTLKVGDFNTLLSPMERSTRQKPKREIRQLTKEMNQMDLTDIYKTFPQIGKNAPSHHLIESSQKLITYLVTKQTSTDIKKSLVTTCVLSNHHGIKVEFNNNSTQREPANSWKLNSQLLNHPQVREEIKQ